MDMNTAAIQLREAREDQAERDYKTFGKQVVEEMVDDLMSNRPVATIRGKKVDLAWILEGEGFISDSEAAALIADFVDDRHVTLLRIEKRAKAMVEKWIETSPLAAEIISDRVRDLVTESEEV
jgi:hypothetical protein